MARTMRLLGSSHSTDVHEYQPPIYFCPTCNRNLTLAEAIHSYLESDGKLVHHGHEIRRIPPWPPEPIGG